MDKLNKNEQKTFTIELYKALGILVGSVIVSSVGGAFLAYRTINSDHFTLSSVVNQVTQLQARATTDEAYIPQFITTQQSVNDLKTELDDIKLQEENNAAKLNQIIGQLSAK